MASCSREKKKNNHFLLEDENPRFFKIILKDSITLHKLGIPRKFVKNYGDYLSSHVMLKVPSCGLKWKVEIVRNEGLIWLQNGWREFAEYYSIVEGSFLVFQFDKINSEFNVIIFDKTATEIDYPLSCFANGDTSHQRSNLDDEGKSTSAVPKANSDLQSENPSFRIVMQPSFLSKRSALVIPPSFANNYLNKNGDASLKVLDGRTWFVNYYSRDIFGVAKTRIHHVGWNKFVQDNHLDVGDVCVFELIDHVQTTFRVAIVKYLMPADLCTSLGNSKESIEKESRSTDRKIPFSNPSFEEKISSRSLRSCMVYVPNSFMSKIAPGTKFVRLKVNNRCWSVKMIMNPEFGTTFLSAGWIAFAKENSLKVGDVCTYRLINNTDQTPLINVSIKRDSGMCLVSNGVERDAEPQVPRKKMKVENFNKEIEKGKSKQSMLKESDAIECNCLEKPSFSNTIDAAKKFTSLNPFFQVVMTSNHIKVGGTLHVPRNFIKNLEPVTRIAQLQVGNRLWSLRMNIYPHHNNKSTFSGWIPFARANSLKVGDVCSFELIDAQNLVIKKVAPLALKSLHCQICLKWIHFSKW